MLRKKRVVSAYILTTPTLAAIVKVRGLVASKSKPSHGTEMNPLIGHFTTHYLCNGFATESSRDTPSPAGSL